VLALSARRVVDMPVNTRTVVTTTSRDVMPSNSVAMTTLTQPINDQQTDHGKQNRSSSVHWHLPSAVAPSGRTDLFSTLHERLCLGRRINPFLLEWDHGTSDCRGGFESTHELLVGELSEVADALRLHVIRCWLNGGRLEHLVIPSEPQVGTLGHPLRPGWTADEVVTVVRVELRQIHAVPHTNTSPITSHFISFHLI